MTTAVLASPVNAVALSSSLLPTPTAAVLSRLTSPSMIHHRNTNVLLVDAQSKLKRVQLRHRYVRGPGANRPTRKPADSGRGQARPTPPLSMLPPLPHPHPNTPNKIPTPLLLVSHRFVLHCREGTQRGRNKKKKFDQCHGIHEPALYTVLYKPRARAP